MLHVFNIYIFQMKAKNSTQYVKCLVIYRFTAVVFEMAHCKQREKRFELFLNFYRLSGQWWTDLAGHLFYGSA